jgi:hypothetical protein
MIQSFAARRAVHDWSTYMRYLLLVALLWSAPALAQRGTTPSGAITTNRVGTTGGAIITNRADPRTSSTTDWRWMTAGIRATEALQRNFWRGDGRAVPRDQFRDRDGRAAFGRFRDRDGRVALGREVRGTPNILTGTSRRIDILSGRPID